MSGEEAVSPKRVRAEDDAAVVVAQLGVVVESRPAAEVGAHHEAAPSAHEVGRIGVLGPAESEEVPPERVDIDREVEPAAPGLIPLDLRIEHVVTGLADKGVEIT